jgi:DNA helicase II / ATP-dependent DNA helicase PcrA
MSVAYLEKLNPEQRRAVEHGVRKNDAAPGTPLLVIAGAGSGKTNTLAHRVAHLIVNGANPRKILLMTFSRRAAAAMARRVERIARRVIGDKAGVMTDALWAGTFHGIGARLLREYAGQIGLNPAFTIHDREDSADLMNLTRHELGFSKTENRFPAKGTCLAIYSRCVNAELPIEDVLATSFPWCAVWAAELKQLFVVYVEAKQRQNVLDYDDLLLYWAQMVSDPSLAGEIGERFDHVLVDEYQDTNRLQASILLALKPGGRGLTVVGDDAQAIYSFRAATVRNILDFPSQFSPPPAIITLDRNYRSTQPILAAANGIIDLACERFTKNLWTDRIGERPQLVSVADETGQADYIVARVLENREGGTTLRQQAVLFRASHHSGPLEVELARRNIPFVKFGGLKFLDAAHIKDMLALLRFAENPRDRVAGFRVMQLMPGVGPTSAQQVLDCVMEAADPIGGLAGASPPPRAGAFWTAFVETIIGLRASRAAWPAELERARLWYEPHLDRIYEDSVTPSRRSDPAPADREWLSFPGTFSNGTYARSAGCDERPGGRSAARGGLSDPFDDPFRQGAGMEVGLRAQCRRWLHSLRPRHWDVRRDRGGAASALCRHDACQGRSLPHFASTFLHPWPECARRPACLCHSYAFHSQWIAGPFRADGMADNGAGTGRIAGEPRRPHRCRRSHARQVAIRRTGGLCAISIR